MDDFKSWFDKGCIILAMDIATSELLKLSKELPCRIAPNITYAKAIKLMQELGQVDIFEYYDKE